MREMLKSLIGIAAAVVCMSWALVVDPTLASAQSIEGFIGGAMRGYGGYGYRGGAPRRSYHATAPQREKEKDKDAKDEDSDKNSSTKDSPSKSTAAKDSADKNAKDASADNNKPRHQLSNAKDDAPPPSTAKVETPKATADDEPTFSPSR